MSSLVVDCEGDLKKFGICNGKPGGPLTAGPGLAGTAGGAWGPGPGWPGAGWPDGSPPCVCRGVGLTEGLGEGDGLGEGESVQTGGQTGKSAPREIPEPATNIDAKSAVNTL
ncbi:MAG: hypothetical protein ABR507_02580 [Actinomycetota bacterium]